MKTSDLGLASALDAAGFKCLGLDRTNPERVDFEFEEAAVEASKLYWRGELMVNSLGYFNSMKNLKSRIRQQ